MTNDRSRKREIRKRMASTGEVYSVAARHVDSPQPPVDTAWSAFWKGYGEPQTEKPNPHVLLKFWMVPYYELVISDWEGDTSAVKELGGAYRELKDKGNYFCFNNYLTEFIQSWFMSMVTRNGLPITKSTSKPVIVTNSLKKFQIQVTNTVIADLLAVDVENGKSVNRHSHNGTEALLPLWQMLGQRERTLFVQELTNLIHSLPSAEEASTPDIEYNQYVTAPPVEKIEGLVTGDRVRFVGERTYWISQAVSSNFVLLTKQAPFTKKEDNQIIYTIIDWASGMRGAHNSYGHGVDSPEDIQRIMDDLERKVLGASSDDREFSSLQLGRNQVALHVQEVWRGKIPLWKTPAPID